MTLSEIVKSPAEEKLHPSTTKGRVASEEMVEIPAGSFFYGPNKEPMEIEAPFSIDICPVTNAQYRRFMKDCGYEKMDLWSDDGKKWLKDSSRTEPRYLDDDQFNGYDQPVVGVCYYEAEAYAKWCDKELPTEFQWERAARWTDGREWPWGNQFDSKKCNTDESVIGKTTDVTNYPGGISMDGCYDMAGNVWEWTKTWYDEDKDRMVLRGGSWNINRKGAHCAIRGRDYPDFRFNIVGFRCLRTKK